MIKVKGVLLVTMLPISSDWLIILKKPYLCAERIREIEIRSGNLGAFPPSNINADRLIIHSAAR